jgi:hypothetical protein
MAYSAKRWGSIEKQHTCVGCGCVFRYCVEKDDPRRILMTRPKDVVATHPCPTCGLVQPEMVMWSKVWHPLGLLAALLAIAVLGAVGGAIKAGPSLVLAAHVGAGLFLTLALVHVGTALANPNRDLQANQATAGQEIESGKLLMVTPGTVDGEVRPPANLTPLHLPALLLLPAGALAFFYPILNLQGDKAPPSNPGLSPSVVVPGDRVSCTIPTKVEGVCGTIWRGKPTVRVLNYQEAGTPETLPAEGSDHQWGTSLRVPKGSGNSTVKPTIHFTVPRDARLAGKTLRLSIGMQMTYPVVYGSNLMMGGSGRAFRDQTSSVSEVLVVKLAEPGRLEQSFNTYLVGLGGGALTLLGGLWLTGLAWSLQLKASHSEVTAAPQPPPSACSSPQERCRPVPIPDDDDVVRAKVGKIDFRRRVGGGPSA